MLTLKQWLAIAGLVVLGATHWLAYDYGQADGELIEAKAKTTLANERADRAGDRLAAERAARKAEAGYAESVAKVAEQYEKDKRDAQAANDRLLANLRSGNERLHSRWRGCEATSAATSGELDAAAREREESAARIIGYARDADDHIRALQELVRQYVGLDK